MPTIYTRKNKDGKASYYANISNNNKRVRKALGNDKKLALKRLKKLEYDLFLNSTNKVQQKCINEAVKSFEEYLSTIGITARQTRDVTAKVKHFTTYCLKQSISNLNDVKREHSNNYIVIRSKHTVDSNNTPLSPVTLKREVGFLKRFFNYCIENDWIDKNPFIGIKIAKPKRPVQRYSFKDCEIDRQRKLCLKSVQKHFTKDFVRSNNINLHTFRHTYAHTMLNKGVPKEVLQALLGHRSIKTTEIYANWIKRDELEKWIN